MLRVFTVLVILSAILLSACGKDEGSNPTAKNPYADAKIEVKTYHADSGWGYDVLVWDAVYIHQPHRPGLPGNRGFGTEEDARKVADLAVKKMKSNEVPPTITVEELKNLGVLK